MYGKDRIISKDEEEYYKSGYGADGRPWSWYQDYALASDMDPQKEKIAKDWIKANIIPAKRHNNKHTSHEIKRDLQQDTEIFTTNNQFKDLMLECGFKPVDEHELNWRYCISEKSPAFQHSV